ncbi:class I SAM-dependent methyltransferase [Corynebacterium xerosis]|uniref:class I SAM-dependent methyltransferase n=1 Tax=Corynebacterium xerosis TaxID=1725 RepID=UPI00311998E3
MPDGGHLLPPGGGVRNTGAMNMHRTWSEIVAADPGHSRRYAERWADFAAQGRDIDGEARLIDAMAPRGGRILDAGCGQGRLGGYLAGRGHRVVGVDIDPYLISVARDVQPGGTWKVGDLANLGEVLAAADADPKSAESGAHPTGDFDVIVAAGNVLTFIDPADRGNVLIGFRDALATDGRAVMGFGAGRGWSLDDFESDAFEAGLRITHRFSTWNLLPFDEHANFIVAIAERA